MSTATRSVGGTNPASGESRADSGSGRPMRHRSPDLVVALSLLIGVIVAIALPIGVVAGSVEPIITGSVLLGFALGWALLAVLSVRFTDQPQRWAVVPAGFLGLVGLGLVVLAPPADAMDLLSWVWPPALLGLVAWTVRAFRRDLHGRSRWLLYPVFGVLVLFAIGGAAETILTALDRDTTPRGQLVDIGGRTLHIDCRGSGSPTVVLQSGLGEDSSYWAQIASEISATTKVCAYDRAGYGSSEPAPEPQDGDSVAADLHALLGASGDPGPYVLVGHSTGGPYVRVFAARHPEQVAGMVFIDAQPAAAFTALPDFPEFYSSYRIVSAVLPSLARIGVGRLLDIDVGGARGTRNEVAMLPSTLGQAAQLTTLGDRPIVVVTATTDIQAGWAEAQAEMVALSDNVSHRTPAGSTHYSLIRDADGVKASSRAILDVVEASRSAGPVAGQ